MMRFAAKIIAKQANVFTFLLVSFYMCHAMPASLCELKTNAKCMSENATARNKALPYIIGPAGC